MTSKKTVEEPSLYTANFAVDPSKRELRIILQFEEKVDIHDGLDAYPEIQKLLLKIGKLVVRNGVAK